jgi:ribosomal protein S18 acetylase RimI-like enzyme
MSPADTRPFMAAGFVLQERLHLLSLRLDCVPPNPPAATFAARRWHRRRVLEIDRAAFDPFWRFDERTLSEAQRATPTSRYRVAREDGCRTGPIAGYAITGRAGPRGYLQRLAVAPASTGRGYGSLLVADALVWLASRGATMVMVNTQETNGRALALYRRLGFVSEPDGLVVLSWGAPA